jgi:carboxypeptidase Taq
MAAAVSPTLLERMADLRALQGAISVLSWDQETYLPAKGVASRGEQLATLHGLHHEKLTAPELGDVLARAEEAVSPEDGEARALLRALRWDRDRAVVVPGRLVRELAETQSRALAAWRDARRQSAFGTFAPFLERLLALRREMADALLPTLEEPGAERYDALLEGYEPGMRVVQLEPLLRRLTGWLVPLVARLSEATAPTGPFHGRRLDGDGQWRITMEILAAMGFDQEAGRQDRSLHPFTIGMDPGDVRVTTRIVPELPFSAIFSTIHEAGHGLYEQGLPIAHRRDPLGVAASMGLHESQSRLWENMVGRSRPFWRFWHPRLQAVFPELGSTTVDDVLGAVNRVERSLIRVEADEVTYNLHIALRFGLELALLRGDLGVPDLPAAWNDASERMLGLRPARDAEGVLQDIHWAWGEIGYFPTYAIGNLYAAALYAAARRSLTALDDELAAGRLVPLRDWLREHVHRQGRRFSAEEIVRRATGRGLQDEDFRAYLESKYAAR